ncbi:MAG: hypothetical protein JO227_08615, partial [Acetobacteraceae bacterium]|nr:hypothetical protein [Acetobacteraceae bacterium]
NFPQMSISGFLYMHDLENLFTLNVLPAPEFETSGPPGHLYISHDLVNTQQATVIGNAVLGVGHNVGATSFELLAGRGDLSTLILDKPPHDSLSNLVDFELSTSPAAARLELGGIAFDQAAYTRAGSTGSLQLMNHGRPVYQLTNVSVFGGSFTTGFDPHTGYDYVLYSSG